MAVHVYAPRLQVILLKMVQRGRNGQAARFQGAEREIDLTPFLGDNGQVVVKKGVREPAGSFSVSFPDQAAKSGAKDSVYGLAEPMDAVEIRGAREPHRYAGKKLPLIMRGFISAVRRGRGVDEEGNPHRAVVLQGFDSGRLWETHQILWYRELAGGNPLLTVFKMQAATGIEVSYSPVKEYMGQLVERVMNKRIELLAAYSSRQLTPFRYDGTVPEGITSPQVAAPQQGPIWNYVELFQDAPWNEAFIEDEEEGPVFRFRPVPFKDLDGKLIMPGAKEPGTVSLTTKDVVSIDVVRSDARVGNFYFTPPDWGILGTSGAVSASAVMSGECFDFDHPNSDARLYGVRQIQAMTRLSDAPTAPDRLPAEQRPEADSRVVAWFRRRMAQLKAMNRDNSVLEDGQAVVRGHEDIRPGRTLRLTDGDLAAEYYVPRVAHSYAPFGTWTTSLVLERGTGFLERSKQAGSPYYRESSGGPYRS